MAIIRSELVSCINMKHLEKNVSPLNCSGILF